MLMSNNDDNTHTSENTCGLNERLIKLNVGGISFCTGFSTLKPSKYLEQLLNGDDFEVLENEEIYIDRDGDLFAIILEYLRSYKIYNADNLYELRCEAKFYQLEYLVHLLDKMLQEQRGGKKKEFKLVTLENLADDTCLSELNNQKLTKTLSSTYEFISVIKIHQPIWRCIVHEKKFPIKDCQYQNSNCFGGISLGGGENKLLLLVAKIPK